MRNVPKLLLLLLLLPMAFLSCRFGGSKKLDRRVTLWRKDKIPYGTFVAYENLSHLFPRTEISLNKNSPVGLLNREGKKAYIIITTNMRPDESDVNAILNLVGAGNHVFISSFRFGDSLLHAVKVHPGLGFIGNLHDSLQLSLYHPVTGDSLSYVYPGSSFDNWISSLDTQYTTVLGRDARGRPNLVKFNYKGGGSLMLQFAPIAFTNFFLLHKNNMTYYDHVLSYIPVSVDQVIWDDYFRYDRTKSFSAFHYILGNQPLRWAFWLLLLLFGTIYLFESKRKQRLVPIREELRNNSLDFVRTIGRLYYQRRDNRDLSIKMATHFQDHIRTRYNLPAALADPAFVDRLSYKTGISASSLYELVGDMQRLQDSPHVTDEELLAFNHKLEEFYKQA